MKTFKISRRYAQFLLLQQLYPDQFLVPCYDMDIVWHTHQVKTKKYKNIFDVRNAMCMPNPVKLK